jgi:hypothetical protein
MSSKLPHGKRNDLFYAAPPFRTYSWLWTKVASITASRSGLNVTAVTGVQFRVCPVHRLGLRCRISAVPFKLNQDRRYHIPKQKYKLPRSQPGTDRIHLLVDSTGVKLCGASEWLTEKHGTRTRRSGPRLHRGVDADTGQIVAAALTSPDADDAVQAGPLLEQIDGPVASFPAMARRPRAYRHVQTPC